MGVLQRGENWPAIRRAIPERRERAGPIDRGGENDERNKNSAPDMPVADTGDAGTGLGTLGKWRVPLRRYPSRPGQGSRHEIFPFGVYD